MLDRQLAAEMANLKPEERSLHRLDAIQMWTKPRPTCREFLQRLANKYVMWIHTNGNRWVKTTHCSHFNFQA